MTDAPLGTAYKLEFFAGGVVKDADGNIIDDSSEKAAQARLKALGTENLLQVTDD
jgi:hypothetical protein